MTAPWEKEEHLCGYGLAKPNTPMRCYHRSCWEDSPAIEVAYQIAQSYWVDDAETEPRECSRCDQPLNTLEVIELLAADLIQMDKDTAIDLTLWPNAQTFVEAVLP